MSSRDAKDKEKDDFTAKGQELIEIVAGYDMIAVVTNKKNGVRDLTVKQIEGIFTGDITDWSEVGGAAGAISVYTRNTTSGTYKSFQGMAMDKRDYGTNTNKMAGNEQIADEVANNPNGIGYVGLAYADKDGLRSVKIEGEAAKPRNKDTYPLSAHSSTTPLASQKVRRRNSSTGDHQRSRREGRGYGGIHRDQKITY